VDLRALLPDSPHFVPGEQTLHFDVAKAVPAATGSASKITIAPGPSAMVPYISTSLPPAAATIFFDRFATVGVWVFPHGVQRLMRIIRGETEQHCNLNWLKNERQTQNGQDVKSYHRLAVGPYAGSKNIGDTFALSSTRSLRLRLSNL